MGAGEQDVRAIWHLARDGKQYGPYQFEVLAQAVSKGVITRDDVIWRPGFETWQRADSVAGLFAPIGSITTAAPGIQAKDVRVEPAAAGAVEASTARKDLAPAAPTTAEKPKSRANYLARHWRGELSLPVSYWLNGLLVLLAATAAGLTFSSFVQSSQVTAGAPMAAALTCFTIVIVLLSTWQMVGIWRSATRYSASGKAFWGTAAKIVVVLGAIRSVVDLGGMSFPIITEHMSIAMGDPRMGEHKFRLLRDGTELEFVGGIKTGTAKEFERMLDAASQVRVVHLNSFGGRLSEADLMASEVRKRRLITYVSDRCESACTHVFLAGRERWIGERGKIGFHQPNIPGLEANVASELVEKERKDLLSMGLPSDFVTKALSTPSDKIWRPTSDELLAARVISGISDASRFASSGRVASLSAAELEEAVVKVPVFAALRRAEPQAFGELIARWKDGYSKGLPEEEITAQARALVADVVRRRLPFAPDEKLAEWVDILIGYMDNLKLTDPESCVALEDESKGARLKSNLTKLYPEISSRELSLKQAIIEADVTGGRSVPTSQQVQPYLEKVYDKLARRSDLRLALFDKDTLDVTEFRPFCELALAFYQELRHLPKNESSAVLRTLYADASK
jgi:hypothetical protein